MSIEWKRDSLSANLGILEFVNLDFNPKRIYWLTDFIKGSTRGNHAHKNLNQAMLALTGEIEIELYRGDSCEKHFLKPSDDVLYISPGTWRTIKSSISSSVLLVICDQEFSEEDYIRNWKVYLDWYSKNYES